MRFPSSFLSRPSSWLALSLGLLALSAEPAIWRNPTGTNVNSQGATTVFITFGGLKDQEPIKTIWCTRLVPAAPAVGQKCDPATILGQLPLRYDQSQLQGGVFYDVMSIPPSVSRKAFQLAETGENGTFFYVRRFRSLKGGPEEFVAVTCRLAGGTARVPLSLLDVQVRFLSEQPVGTVQPGSQLPLVEAKITYNGTGQLRGRWEVVRPGEDPPTSQDLLTEATLPPSLRGTQRRYTLVDRFSVFLAPGAGPLRLKGPDPSRFPTEGVGLYQILLRVEATSEREADSNAVEAGGLGGIIPAGGVAGFPMPVLKYFVGSAPSEGAREALGLLLPAAGAEVKAGEPIVFVWSPVPGASFYRLEVRDESGAEILTATLGEGVQSYRAPSWLPEKAKDGSVSWRVRILNSDGEPTGATDSRTLKIVTPKDQPSPSPSPSPAPAG